MGSLYVAYHVSLDLHFLLKGYFATSTVLLFMQQIQQAATADQQPNRINKCYPFVGSTRMWYDCSLDTLATESYSKLPTELVNQYPNRVTRTHPLRYSRQMNMLLWSVDAPRNWQIRGCLICREMHNAMVDTQTNGVISRGISLAMIDKVSIVVSCT